MPTLRDAYRSVRRGRRRLDTIGAEILSAVADPGAPWLDTPAGARQLQTFLTAKARDIRGVIADAVADSRARVVLLDSLSTGYPPGTDPRDVSRWWSSLTPTQRDRLIAEHQDLGNRNGIPTDVRDEINRQVLTDDISRVDNATEAVSAADMVRYRNALEVRAGLSADSGRDRIPMFLHTYDPGAFDGRGRVAIAIGNPDTADDTAVVVLGARSSVSDGRLSRPGGLRIYDEVVRANPGKTNSVVVWLGYRAPDGLADPQVAQTALARAGGVMLAADVDALRVTHGGASHLTVIGHSYGSTTVADAAAGAGMVADDVVLVGSPGTDLARNADDFHLPDGGHVYVGAASSDPVTHLAGEPRISVPGSGVTVGLGGDPAADGYGSVRFKAETPGLTSPSEDHGSYFDPGSESLFSIGDIVSGHGDALAHDRMTAAHRHRLPRFDPEAVRPGTGGHRH